MTKGCNNQATYMVKTEYGPYYMCGRCITDGHMASRDKLTQKFPITTNDKCQCEYFMHYEEK